MFQFTLWAGVEDAVFLSDLRGYMHLIHTEKLGVDSVMITRISIYTIHRYP